MATLRSTIDDTCSTQRGRRAAADVEPSPEVKRLIGQANQAYAEGSLDTAVELLSEVVRIDPIIRVSWYTLATIYEEKGDQERAVQCKIVATHLLGKDQAAAEWASLGRECRCVRSLWLLTRLNFCTDVCHSEQSNRLDAAGDLLLHPGDQGRQGGRRHHVGPRSVAQALGCQDHGTDTTARGVDNQVLIRKFRCPAGYQSVQRAFDPLAA